MSLEAHQLGPVFTTRKRGKPTIYFAFCACGHKSRSSVQGDIYQQHASHLVATVPPLEPDRDSPRWQRIRAALCEHTGLGESLDVYADRVWISIRHTTAPTAHPQTRKRVAGAAKGD